MEAPAQAVPSGETLVASARRFVSAGVESCTALHRGDLAQRLGYALSRLDESSTVLYVAGEYKQGKSMLVNALVGATVCPVDDDLSTSTATWVYHHDPAMVTVRPRDANAEREVPIGEVWKYASERGKPGNRLGVDLVKVGVPSRVLAQGLALIDTPGAGALNGRGVETALSFLPYASALVFVTDASAELSRAEVDFLSKGLEVCPSVLVVLTKIDLYPEWRRIAELDRAHLDSYGLPATVLPVSSTLRTEALARSDPTLNEESGFPALLSTLRAGALAGAERRAALRALDESSMILGQAVSALRTEQEALANPESAKAMTDQLNDARGRLLALRRDGSRWGTVLGDGITDLNQEIDRYLRSSVRSLLDEFDRRIGQTDPAGEWDEITDNLQASGASLAGDVFDRIQSGAARLADRVADDLATTGLAAPEIATANGTDLGGLWDPETRSLDTGGTGPIAASLGALRGTSSGVVLLGVMSRLAGIAVGTPVAVGVGVLFGIKQVIDERKRRLERRRQRGNAIVREYLNRVQAELSVESRKAVQSVHRSMRDAFAQQITDLNAALSRTAQAVEASIDATDRKRQQRLSLLSRQIEHLDRLITQTDAQRKKIEESAP